MAGVVADENSTEERYFVELFDETLELNRGEVSDDALSNAVVETIAVFNEGPSNSCAVEHFRTPAQLWAYFYRFSPISAGLARNRMLQAIRNSEEFRMFLKRPSLEVLSIGSGPGSDLIGLCSVLYEKGDFQKLNLTLVDNNKHWKSLFESMIQVTREGVYGNASSLFNDKEISSSFIWATALRTDDYLEALRKADIVWMKGLLSILRTDSSRHTVINDVASSMRARSLLVVIDSPSYLNFENVQMLRQVYSMEERKYHFSEPSITFYYPGLCRNSNQIITVLAKE
ncbi:uncharacterized protein NPIL_603161 [Nephila pilipes]|uniref:Uncharacterized protein n=1 Tax=Nephila pilipes TaxID=299642 RepID=A0A8X6NN00_NEPPI|nr:uncharacterized protein NPIL_603161 [Nephila pilipes]